MANSTTNRTIRTQGREGYKRHLPVDGGTHIYKGILVSQLTATGALVPLSTASAGQCIGVSQHEADNTNGSDGDIRCEIETDRLYEFDNGSDAFTEAHQIGAVVYASDDHTVERLSNGGARSAVGIYMGLTDEGRVVVWVSPALAQRLAAIVALTDSTGGSADNTLAAVSGSGDDATINNNFADLAAKVNALIARG